MITYKASEYLPFTSPSDKLSCWVVSPDHEDPVCYDYDDGKWYDCYYEQTEVKEWRYPDPKGIMPGASLEPQETKVGDSKYEQLRDAFEELLVEQFVIKGLRDVWRKKAGILEEVLAELAGGTLLEFIESLPDEYSKDSIFKHKDKWHVTNEWLVGRDLSIGFEAHTKELAAESLIEYLDGHVGHDSEMGLIVTQSGWPDLEKVLNYLNNNKS